MAASGKVYVCGRCGDYGAPNLEDLVTHMTNCGVPEIRKKGETTQYEDNDVLFDDSENSDDAIEFVDITDEKYSPQKEKVSNNILTCSIVSPGYLQNHVIDADRTSPAPFLWSKKTALLLLNLLKSHKDDMESPYIRRKTVWQKIALEMQQKYKYCVSASQCENKFKNMSNRYRKARENNQRPDCSVKKTCFLYDELDEYFNSDARYQPRRDSIYNSIDKSPKIIRPVICNDSEADNDEKEQEQEQLNTSEVEEKTEEKTAEETMEKTVEDSLEISAADETEPVWVKKMMETFERCHKENMKMQREFIDVLKKILEKK